MKTKLRHDKYLRLVGFIQVILLTSCGYHRPYPADWSPLPEPQAKDCQSIAGTYKNWGEMVGHPEHPSLAGELFGFGTLGFAPDKVTFSLPDPNTLEVTVLGTEGEVFQRTLSTKDHNFACEDGHAVVTDQRWFDADVAFGRESLIIELIPSADYLITHDHNKGFGLVFLIMPVVGDSASWYRFERLNDQPKAESETHMIRRENNIGKN